MKASLIFGFLLVLLPGIALANRLDIFENDDGKDLFLNLGDLLMVNLQANPSTGYDWSFSSTMNGILEQVGDVTRERTVPKGLVANPITEIWTIKAIVPGTCRLIFSYARPWEKGVAPVRTVSLNITVRP